MHVTLNKSFTLHNFLHDHASINGEHLHKGIIYVINQDRTPSNNHDFILTNKFLVHIAHKYAHTELYGNNPEVQRISKLLLK